ncbi:unnamed protein product, partial [Dovyalis caffra]
INGVNYTNDATLGNDVVTYFHDLLQSRLVALLDELLRLFPHWLPRTKPHAFR